MSTASLQFIRFSGRGEKTLRQKIITSRVELEDFQETGDRAIRWLKRYRSKTPQLSS